MELNMSFANTSVAPAPLVEQCDRSDFDFTWVPPYIYTISALGILFNLLVLLVFLLHKKNCTATEIYLSNMAAADILLMVFIPLWGVSAAKNSAWPFGDILCKTCSVLVIINYDCSIYFLVLVSIDRFTALVYPLTQCRLRRQLQRNESECENEMEN
uniref:G-protein coupled receptors family 1 profile domain-containing protein n=1 Tax=Knipowitschia caucasica TaxID=637954 RepID=A0AAV2JEI4_KNICA